MIFVAFEPDKEPDNFNLYSNNVNMVNQITLRIREGKNIHFENKICDWYLSYALNRSNYPFHSASTHLFVSYHALISSSVPHYFGPTDTDP